MRCPRGVAAALSFVLVFLMLPLGGVAEPPVVHPAAVPPYDIAPWSIGDTWSYRTRILAADPSGLTTDAVVQVDTTVAGVETVTVLGRTYTAYNTTVSGQINAQGAMPPATYTVASTDLSGWILTDRSNLARIAENETFHATGFLQVFIFTYPLWINTTTTVRHGPAEEDYDFPLELGDTWSYQGVANTTGYAEFFTTAPGAPPGFQPLSGEAPLGLRSWFNATGPANVPAGAFPDAARIHSEGSGTASDWWYHPDVRNFVKMETHTVNGPSDYMHVWTNLTAYSLAPAAWPGTISLDPARVNPGGWVTASGLANPNEDLVVRLPATGDALPVRADAGGAWSVPFRAPTSDDFTPANADAGSHGVVVEPAASPAGWNVTTVQLILPDLVADSADLVLSDPAPRMGVPFDVNATLRVGPSVDVRSPFNVTFSIDGAEVQRFVAGNLTAGGSQTFGITWSGPPGWHTATFTADPDGAVRETDEGNNTATRAFRIVGTDLVPWNITVASDVVDVYTDPAATGYASLPVQGRFGALVNLTFDAENVGTGDAGAFSVAVVETAGLRGPPVGPRLLDAAVPSLGAGNRTGPFAASWPVPSSPGVYHLNVTVDADAQVAETWEENNTFVVIVNVSGPDYRVSSVDVPAKVTAGSGHTLSVTVRNEGQRDGNRTVAVAAYEGPSPTPFATGSLPPIPVGGFANASLSWTAPSSAANPTIRFVVDPADVLDEMIETNNEASASVDVRDAPLTEIAVTGRNVTRTVLYVTSDATFAITVTDRSGEGASAWLRIDGGTDVAYVGPFSLTAEGPHAIEYWGVDGLGGRDATHALAVTVDDTAPVTTLTERSRAGDTVVVNLTATDGGGVGVSAIEYRLDGGAWTPYEGTFEITGYGSHNVTYRSVDLLGNAEAERTAVIAIERAPAATANYKPVLAAVFAAVLVALGLWRQRGARWSPVSPGAAGVVFAAAEAATGVASLWASVLAVPPLGAGLALDVVLFLAGLFAVMRARSPPKLAEGASEPPEPDGAAGADEAGTDK